MRKENLYRCTCCEQLRRISNRVLWIWDAEKLDSDMVYICRACGWATLKSGTYGVKQFLKGRGVL